VTHRRQPLPIALAVLWDKRRTLPRYAEGFADLLAAHIQQVFPDTRPALSGRRPAGRKRVSAPA